MTPTISQLEDQLISDKLFAMILLRGILIQYCIFELMLYSNLLPSV